jgi:hypothetical protein
MTTPLYDEISHPTPNIIQALVALAPDAQWLVKGEITNQTDFTNNVYKVTGTDSNGSAILSNSASDVVLTWTAVNAKWTELKNAHPISLLRLERNRLLAETDFYALSDVTMSSQMTTYRQTLRDITDTYSSLDTVTWPTKP